MIKTLQKFLLTAFTCASLFMVQDADAQCALGETAQTFTATGAAQSWTVPAGVTSITVTAVGADGGTGHSDTVFGGTGATATGTFTVAPGDNLSVVVGVAGGNNTNVTGITGGGGGGGGGTGVANLTTTTTLIVAGGGGGSSLTFGKGGVAVAGGGGGGAAGDGAIGNFNGGGGGGGGSITAAGATGAYGLGPGAGGGSAGFGAAGGIPSGTNGGGTPGPGGYGVGGGGSGADAGVSVGGGGGGGGGFTGGSGNLSALSAGGEGGEGGGTFIDASGTATSITAGTNGGSTIAPASGSVVICFVIPLPVNFVSFDAYELINNAVQLDWVTVNEKSNDYFEVQHSVNGQDFATIGKQLPVDAIDGFHNYKFTHTDANTGDNFYRIKQVDMGGKSTYTEVNLVSIAALNQTEISVYPNIVDNKDVTIKIDAKNNQTAQLQITAANGQIIEMREIAINAGLQKVNLNTDAWSAGLHIIQISQGETVKQFKVIKK